jgi:EmrB/QacA subfamily drug resistance transporter
MRKWLPLTAVCIGAFMLLVDTTIVVVALPSIGSDLNTGFEALQWVVDAYTLTLAALLLATGTLADRLGLRRTFLISLGAFAVASLACGLAPTAAWLVASRALQGIAGAALFASSMALLNLAYQGKDRAVAFGVWGAVNGVAAAVGPILGGLLTEHLDWRAVFLVNLPVSIIAIALGANVLHESRHRSEHRFDLTGAALFTVWAASITYALIEAGDAGWTSPDAMVPAGLSVVAIVGFVAVERRRREPLLDLSLFARPAFVGAILAAAFISVAAFSYFVITSVWLQTSLDLDPVAAGAALLPMSGAAFVASAVLARRLHHVAPWAPISVGLVLIGVGAWLQTGLDASSSWSALTLGLAVAGAGVGICLPPLNAAVMSAVPPRRGGMGAGALNTARQVGMALGIAVLGTVFTGALDGAPLTERAAAAEALGDTMTIAAIVGLTGALLAALLISRRAHQPEPVSTASPAGAADRA